MNKYLARYCKQTSDKFNEELINGKNDKNIIDDVREVFKTLEMIPFIHVEDVRMDTNEEEFGPIRDKGQYYKSVNTTRLQKIHFVIRIDGLENKIEQDLYMLKLLDNQYYINESTMYFPIWEIVPNFTVHTNNGIMPKPLTMPLTITNTNTTNYTSAFSKLILTNVNTYEAVIFNKQLSLFIYYIGKCALDTVNEWLKENSKPPVSNYSQLDQISKIRSTKIIDKFNQLMGSSIKFADDVHDLIEDDRVIFTRNDPDEKHVAFSMPSDYAETELGRFIVSMILDTRKPNIANRSKRNRQVLSFTYDDLINPVYWLSLIGQIFTKTTDPVKRYKKAESIFVSIERTVGNRERTVLPIPTEAKQNFYELTKYIVANAKTLIKRDNMDLKYMKLNLFEYILYPLRVRFNTKIASLSNQTSVTPDDCAKIFKNLSPMFLVRELVNSGLIHIYESTNTMSLFSMTLKATFIGPAGGASRNLTVTQRDIHPSFNGRLDLVISSPGNPGASTILVPTLKLYDDNNFDDIKISK